MATPRAQPLWCVYRVTRSLSCARVSPLIVRGATPVSAFMAVTAAVTSGDAGWFQQELTQMLDGLVRYYLGTSHWNNPDALLKANAQDDEEEQEQEVTVAAAAAASAMSRSWSRLKRSVWDNAVTNRLSTVREFSTMSEILRSVATEEASDALSEARRTLRESKPPFIVLLGGGMAAGKSTVVHRLKSDWE